MNGILYFSSTGNSLYIAKKVKEKFGGSVVYIPSYSGDGSEFKRLFIVTPIYSYGLPTFVYDLLPRLDKAKELIIILNYGGMVGGADYLAYTYCNKNELNIKAIYTLKMPENFTLTFSVPKFYQNMTLKSADNRIDGVLQLIASEEYIIPKECKTKEETYLKNKSDWHIIGNRFSVTDDCVKCQKCVLLCPAGNISLKDGIIEFADSCVACLGCYHRCPEKAIIYMGKKKKDRYINPNISEGEIGKNL